MKTKNKVTPKRAIKVAAVGAVALVLGAAFLGGRPPQMGADEEVFRTVDALFTAVTARDAKLLGQCEQRIHAYRDAGKLPAASSDYLDGIIQTARADRWRPAAERLYDFMRVQRRDGPATPPKEEASIRPKSKRR